MRIFNKQRHIAESLNLMLYDQLWANGDATS